MRKMQVALTGAFVGRFFGSCADSASLPADHPVPPSGHYYKLVPLRHARRSELRAEVPARSKPKPQRLGLPT